MLGFRRDSKYDAKCPPTSMPGIPTAPTTAGIEIVWDIPEGDELPPQQLIVGESITFVWNGVSDVYIHPSGNCDTEGSIFVGNESGVVYTFDTTGTENITFATQIGSRCEMGQIMQVIVGFRFDDNGTSTFVPCFSGDALVDVERHGPTAMSSLKIGDRVLVGGNKYESIYSFGHRNVEASAEFLQIFSEDGSAPVEISCDHLILTTGEHWVPAETLEVGDRLIDSNGQSVSITKIKRINRKGVFAPFTKSGVIVVNNIVASNCVGFQGSEYLLIGGVPTPFAYHWMAHIFNSVHRVAVSTIGITGETYTDKGVSQWVDVPHKCGLWLLEQHPIVMVMTLIPAIGIFAMIAFLEQQTGTMCCVLSILVALILSYSFQIRKGKA